MTSQSTSASTSPRRTMSPFATCGVKPRPSSFTVSIPMWMSTWTPDADLMPYAWPVGKATVTLPSHGATTTAPVAGDRATPGPSAPAAKASSATSDSATIVPAMGEVSVRSAFASSLKAGAASAAGAAAGAAASAAGAAGVGAGASSSRSDFFAQASAFCSFVR